MLEVQNSFPSFQSPTEGLQTLIDGINGLDNFTGTVQDLPEKLKEIVAYLEQQGYNFSEVTGETPLIHDLIDAYNMRFVEGENRKFQLSYPIDATKSVVKNILTLSPEAEEKLKHLQLWLDIEKENKNYLGIEKIEENVSVHNDGLHIETTLGVKALAWKGHTFEGVDTLGENLKAQKYTIEELGAIIEALGGTFKLQKRFQIGGPETSLFLSEIVGLKLGQIYWSSSEFADDDGSAWGILVGASGVFVTCESRRKVSSSLASQNA